MSTYTPWDRAVDLLGLLKAADALAYDSRTDFAAYSGLVAVINMAQRLADELVSETERAELANREKAV